MPKSTSNKGQLFIIGALILIIGIVLVGSLFFSNGEGAIPVQGTPTKDPQTGLYPVNIIVMGHRDWTALHMSLHSNIRTDFVSYYFEGSYSPPSGITWAGFNKLVHVTVTVNGTGLSMATAGTFDSQVSLGATWGQVLTFYLPSGQYSIVVQSVDQDGFISGASTTLFLP